jgi:hypothetical protein
VGIVIVLAIAVTVGVLVYRLTDSGDVATQVEIPLPEAAPDDVLQWAGGEVGDRDVVAAGEAPDSDPARLRVSPETEIPVVSARRSWSSRLSGGLGLVVAIGVGAVAIALTLYVLGTLVARLISAGVDAG